MPRLSANLADAKTCAKCGSSGPTHRHHKGCDGLLGVYNKHIKRDYDKWLDCVLLCYECHMTVHYLYDIWYLFAWKPSFEAALVLRPKLIKLCDRWLADEVATPRVPKTRRLKFKKSFERWRKEKS
jgi:hypothetical protein